MRKASLNQYASQLLEIVRLKIGRRRPVRQRVGHCESETVASLQNASVVKSTDNEVGVCTRFVWQLETVSSSVLAFGLPFRTSRSGLRSPVLHRGRMDSASPVCRHRARQAALRRPSRAARTSGVAHPPHGHRGHAHICRLVVLDVMSPALPCPARCRSSGRWCSTPCRYAVRRGRGNCEVTASAKVFVLP